MHLGHRQRSSDAAHEGSRDGDNPASGRTPILDGRTNPSRYLSLASAVRAASSSFFLFASIVGYARSSCSTASTIAAATKSRVNNLLSAGTTYHGACFDAVARIAS